MFNLFKKYEPEDFYEDQPEIIPKSMTMISKELNVLTPETIETDSDKVHDEINKLSAEKMNVDGENNEKNFKVVLESNKIVVTNKVINGPSCINKYASISDYTFKDTSIEKVEVKQYVQNDGLIAKSDIHYNSFFIIFFKPQTITKQTFIQNNIDINFVQYSSGKQQQDDDKIPEFNIDSLISFLRDYKINGLKSTIEQEQLSNIKMMDKLKLLRVKNDMNNIPKKSYIYVVDMTSRDSVIPNQLMQMMNIKNTVYINRAVYNELYVNKKTKKYNECLLLRNKPTAIDIVKAGFDPQCLVVTLDETENSYEAASATFWEWFSAIVTK